MWNSCDYVAYLLWKWLFIYIKVRVSIVILKIPLRNQFVVYDRFDFRITYTINFYLKEFMFTHKEVCFYKIAVDSVVLYSQCFMMCYLRVFVCSILERIRYHRRPLVEFILRRHPVGMRTVRNTASTSRWWMDGWQVPESAQKVYEDFTYFVPYPNWKGIKSVWKQNVLLFYAPIPLIINIVTKMFGIFTWPLRFCSRLTINCKFPPFLFYLNKVKK